MSMLGSQIDRLRTAAQTERALGHHELEQMLLDAADTITELRGESDCVGMAAYEFGRKSMTDENAKMRELVKKLVILAFARCADCDLFDASCALVPTQKCLLWNECECIARELGIEV